MAITNDDREGNYIVELFARRNVVARLQTRTMSDATEEAWKVYRRRQQNTNTLTRKVTVSQIGKRIGKSFAIRFIEDITSEMRRRWSE